MTQNTMPSYREIYDAALSRVGDAQRARRMTEAYFSGWNQADAIARNREGRERAAA